MHIQNTKDAFLLMLEEKGINQILGVDKSTVSNWKKNALQNKGISTEKMEEMLIKFGAKQISPPIWNLPIHNVYAGEVRVGNILMLQYNDNDYQVIIVNGRYIKDLEEKRIKLSGIKLTESLLKIIGFKEVQIDLFYLQPLHLQKETSGWFHLLSSGYVSLTPILYLHEIQNLYYASNRKEININFSQIENNLEVAIDKKHI